MQRYLNTRSVLLFILLLFPVFGCLSKLPILLWDESRLAINAIEMSQSNNWLVTTYNLEPDHWNTKPPLLIWIQALMIKVFGISELSIRLPIAIAVFCTLMFMYSFVKKWTKQNLLAALIVFVLVNTSGYMTTHVARTGDYDGLLVMFTTLFSLTYFNYLETFKPKYLYLFFLFLALGVLTKSIAGLIFIPGLFIYTLLDKKVLSVIKSKHFYFGIVLFLGMVLPYYFLREKYDPGYLNAVFENEIGGRFNKGLEDHNKPFYQYFFLIIGQQYYYWLGLTLILVSFKYYKSNGIVKKINRFSAIVSFSFLIIISISKTKLGWYDAPIFPFFAIITGTALFNFIVAIKDKQWYQTHRNKKLVLPFILLLLFAYPYGDRINREIISKQYSELDRFGYFIREQIKQQKLNNVVVVSDQYTPTIDYYVHYAQSQNIELKKDNTWNIKIGDTVAFYENEVLEKLNKQFEFRSLLKSDTATIGFLLK